MTDPRIRRLATLITTYSTPIQPGETAAILGGVDAVPLLSAIEHAILILGGHPVVIPTLESIVPIPGLFSQETLLHGNDDQLAWISPVERFAFEEAKHLIVVITDPGATHLAKVAPERMALAQQAKASYVGPWLQRSADGDSDWILTIYPTDAGATDAGMDLEAYQAFIFGALQLDQDDPVAAWQALATTNAQLIGRLCGASTIHVEAPGTDLTFQVGGRTWINADGKNNLPDGEVFTAPHETSATGHICFPGSHRIEGRAVSDIMLSFVDGVVTEAHASTHEDVLHRLLDTDDGARRIGEFAFGTNFGITQATNNPLLDEKVGGTIHLALGAAYPESGGTNASAIHHDLICDLRSGGQVSIDGTPFLVEGRFVD